MDTKVELQGRSAHAQHWLTTSVLGIGVASFLSDMGHEAGTSVLPALLLTFGAAPAVLGVIEGVADGLSAAAKLVGGAWADHVHRRKTITVGGYLITGLSIGAFAVATRWAHVLAVRALGWAARGIRGPARDAMLADAVPPESVGRAFGFHRTMDTLGAVVGPLFAMVLVARVPLRAVFVWCAVPGVLAAVAFAILVRQPDGAPVAAHPPMWQRMRQLPPSFHRFLVAVFFFGIGDFARTLLIWRATALLTPTRGAVAAAATAAVLYAWHNLVYAAGSYPVGHLADRMSPRRLLVVGYGLGVVTAVLAALATPSLAMLVLLFAAAGLTLAFEDTLEATVTAHVVSPALRGSAYGALAAVNGVGDFVSSSLVGVVWSMAGAPIAFAIAAALCLSGTLLLAAGRWD